MAVIQISQIQVRRGLLQDLGQLGAGEFGWAVDKLRLFIGNGTVEQGSPYEGNTEIITVNSDILSLLANYVYKGFLGGYQVLTGPELNLPTFRTIQDKMDDMINIRDFGALGDGLNDDTDAIQRCINEIYNRRSFVTPGITRRTINFHPGNYVITRDLLIPPYCVFRNSGKDSVVITQTSLTANCVFKTTNALGFSSDMFNNGLTEDSELGPVEMSGITFKSDVANIPVAIIDSTKGASFSRCRFEGEPDRALSTTGTRGVKITSAVSSTSAIYFSECDFYKTGIAAEITNVVGLSNVAFDRCTFANIYQGFNISSDTGQVLGIRVTNSVFDQVAAHAIVTSSESVGVVSAYNTFINVGHNYTESNNPSTPVLEFNGNSSYSFGDIITRSAAHDAVIPAIRHGINKNVISNDASNSIKLGHSYLTIGKSIISANDSVNYVPLLARFRQGLINYSIERNNEYRSGVLKFALNPVTLASEFHDSYTETDSVGVVVSVEFNSSTGTPRPFIVYATNDSGYPSTITYDVKSLIR